MPEFTGVSIVTAHQMSVHHKSDLRKVSAKEITSEMIYHAAGDGDMLACEAFATTGAILGRALANVVAITGPEAIFLLGGLSRAGELIFKPARESMEKNLFPVFRKKVKILPSALKGQNAAVLGAGTLAWKDLNSL
jgi:glucokinase